MTQLHLIVYLFFKFFSYKINFHSKLKPILLYSSLKSYIYNIVIQIFILL